jgi:hypothetical protein
MEKKKKKERLNFDKNYLDNNRYLMQYMRANIKAPFTKRVLQFKIELPEILPSIWRRILVPSHYNFWDLHIAIQDSMGWFDCHQHFFEIQGKRGKSSYRLGVPDFEEGEHRTYPDWEIPLLSYFDDLGVTAKYLYDFGDSWWHSVQLEGYIFKDKTVKYPLCIDGERACPPEDCGGTHGYYELLRILSDPQNENYEDMKTWVGPDWDSEKFDLHDVKFGDPLRRWKRQFTED